MRLLSRIGTGVLRWTAVAALVLATIQMLFVPDMLSFFIGGPLGGRRNATFVLYGISAVTALAAFALTPRQNRNGRRKTLLALGLCAIPLSVIHAVNRPPYTRETIRYPSADGAPLEATLYVPRGRGPHPAVVMVHGSAPIRRGSYDVWADPIARHGFIVLVADKRGVGGSGGTFDRTDNTGEANIALLAADVVAGVDQLHQRLDVLRGAIGLFGVSQAGWVAPRAAASEKRVRYLALITAPTVSTHEENRWSVLRGDHGDPIAGRAAAESVLDTLTSKGIDARNDLSVRRIPGLWLFGSDDNSVPTKKSVRVLDSLRARGFPYEWRVYPGYGHGLVGRGGALVPRIAPESWSHLLDWLERTATTTAASPIAPQEVSSLRR